MGSRLHHGLWKEVTKMAMTLKGRQTYLHEKLRLAIQLAMFRKDPMDLAAVFELLGRGIQLDVDIGEKDGSTLPYLRDDRAREQLTQIKRLIEPSEADAADPEAGKLGTLIILARRMTRDDCESLRLAMLGLYDHLSSFEAPVA